MCALLAAGCGSEERPPAPQLPGALAERLAARSDAVADRLEQGDPCAARAEAETLQAEAIAAVNERRVPEAFQEELVGSVNALIESIECVPPPPPDGDEEEKDDDEEKKDDGEDRGEGEKKGKGKKEKDDD